MSAVRRQAYTSREQVSMASCSQEERQSTSVAGEIAVVTSSFGESLRGNCNDDYYSDKMWRRNRGEENG
jgi:hypothetical protein